MVKSSRVIQDFYSDVVKDPLLRDIFRTVSISDLAEHQADVLVMVMGGARSHSDRVIRHAHTGLRINEAQFGAMILHLERRLLSNGFDQVDTDQIIESYRGYQAIVTGV
jgi:hemoglobin